MKGFYERHRRFHYKEDDWRFFVLLPILLFYLLLAEILELFVGLATPIADLFPEGTFDQTKFPVVIAILLIAAISFLLGVAMHAPCGTRFGRWVESRTIGRLHLYKALKNVFTGFIQKKDKKSFKPALLKTSESDEFAFVVEDLGNQKLAILLPWAPTPFAGTVKVVERDRIELLDADLGEFTRVLSLWGVGAGELTRKTMFSKNENI